MRPGPVTELATGGAPHGGSPARVTRHHLADRVYHWIMAASVVALLITSFFPIFGWKFPWVAPHWIAGLILTLAVLVHIVRASFWQGLGTMGLGAADVREASASVRAGLGAASALAQKPGKYPLAQKLYHHVAATVVLAAIVTGLIMMTKLDTPFWARNPYWLSSQTWGLIYVVHGLSAMATVTLLMAHVYFAVRPEKLWMTRSMILGWITRREFIDHFDPERWRVSETPDESSGDAAPTTAASASSEPQTTGKPAE